MRIVVIGAGSQGCYIAGLLSLAGENVTLIARAARAAELAATGVTVARAGRSPDVVRLPVADGAAAAGGVADLIILAVKTYDLVEAARDVAPLVGPQSHLMTIQNGVAAPELVAGLYGEGRIVACVSYTRTFAERPGVVSSGGVSGGLEIGAYSDAGDTRFVDRVVKIVSSAGLDARRRDDIQTALWEKLLVICVTGGVMALARSPLGPILAGEDGREFVRAVIAEADTVGTASGTPLPADATERAYDFVTTQVEPAATSSMLEDLLAGRRLELEYLNGEIVRRGRELGIPTPMNLAVCAALAPYAAGGRRN